MDKDIVYILKHDVAADELRYSLRSVCENFCYRDVWFYCGCPDGIMPDHHIAFEQVGTSKWERSCSTLRAICGNDDITPSFYLFNDDFFIIEPYEQDMAITDRSIWHHAFDIMERHGRSAYVSRLLDTARWLEEHGYPTVNYSTHTPLLVNRATALEVIDGVPSEILFRSVYGNVSGTPYADRGDGKIVSRSALPEPGCPVISTTDKSFRDGEVGKWVRERFAEPCRYEEGN